MKGQTKAPKPDYWRAKIRIVTHHYCGLVWHIPLTTDNRLLACHWTQRLIPACLVELSEPQAAE